MNLLKVLRIVIIADSVVAVLKLVYAIILIDHGYKRSWSMDDKYIFKLAGFVLHSALIGAVLVLNSLRLMANYHQYKNEEGFHVQNMRKFGCCRCLRFGDYIYAVVVILFMGLSVLYYAEGIFSIPAIIFLCWEVVILCVLVLLKSMMKKAKHPNVVQDEQRNSKEETAHEENEKFSENQ